MSSSRHVVVTLVGQNIRASYVTINEGISAVSICRQVAALVLDMFYNFYLVKNHKIVNNSPTTEAREKISTFLKIP
jgi:hypothetical protein